MKQLTTLIVALMLFSASAIAQTSLYWNPTYFSPCNSGTNSITPQVGTVPGLSPADSALPCSVIGQPVHDTLYFKNFSTFSVATVNSLKFDSIYLPAGLCWSSNKVNNTFATGEDGVIYITGTPTGSAGSYKLRIIADVNTTIGNFVAVDMEALAHLRYHSRIVCNGNPCPVINPADSMSTFTADASSCSGSSVYASITASGSTALCTHDTVTLTANSGTGYTYHWTTGATTRSIRVTTAGSYTVTVSNGVDTAVAAPVNVTVSTCSINASITAGGSTNICAGASVTLTANSGSGYTYYWTNGSTAQSITVNTAGSYTVTVSNGTSTAVATPVNVTINNGCAVTYWNPGYFSPCNSGTNAVLPFIGTVPGLSPPDTSIPCSVIGQPVSDTLYFKNFTTFSVATVNSLKFDSIYLPAGLCWSSNKANNTFSTGEDGVIVISGTPTSPAGQYKLRMIVDVNTTIGNFSAVDLEALAHLRYRSRVVCSGYPCQAMDPDTVNTFIADSRCSGAALTASISPSGSIALCTGDTTTLTANAGAGYTYRWSTGATTRAISVSAVGTYRVTVYSGADTAVSAPVIVSISAICNVSANISANGPTTFCSPGSVTLFADSNAHNYTYRWSTGATTQYITVSSSGSYQVTVHHGVDSAVSAPVAVIANTICNVGYWSSSYFSDCNSGTNVITPGTGSTPGLAPSDSAMACAVIGQPVSDTIYFTNFTTFSVATVNSLKIDSLYLPAGLCWNTNKANNTFGSGENGVIYISGTPTAPAGQYKLRIIADVNTTIGNFAAVDAEALAHLRYSLRVVCAANLNPPLNRLDTVSSFIPDNNCSQLPVATITPNGPLTFCQGSSVTLSAPSGVGSTYTWSTGATSQSIVVTTSGSYTVTVQSLGVSAASAPTVVVVNAGPTAHFQLTPDPNTPHVWIAINQCTGNNLTYSWIWGDHTAVSTGATPTHTYADTGYYTICVAVNDANGCSDNYCDSSVYLYKDANQMIQMNVVQYALGVNDLNQNSLSVKCYAEALHFAPSISTPSEVKLYDMSGRVVMKQSNWLGSSLAVDAIASGVYVVAIQNNAMSVSRKVLITR
jgi:hypothetical protein